VIRRLVGPFSSFIATEFFEGFFGAMLEAIAFGQF
jgi:hypothetical protein